MRDVEKVIEGLKQETIREITKKDARPEAQLAWYWTYIGSLDMAQQLGLINDSREREGQRAGRWQGTAAGAVCAARTGGR